MGAEFRSIYRHGFARVAACTTRCTLADPAANAAAILDVARDCHKRGVALAVFPELGVSGYAISDLLQQSTLLDAVEAAIANIVAASRRPAAAAAGRRAAAPRRRALQLRAGDPSRPPARRGAEGPPAQLPRILRAAAFRGGRRHGRRRDHHRRATPRRSAPTCCSPPTDVPDFVVHAEICEDIWVPIPPSSQAALAGATVLANLSASNITIGKAETRRLLCASQSARCVAAYLYAAAGAGESTTDLAWDGQAVDLRERRHAGRDRTLPRRQPVRAWPTSTSTCCATSACRWAASTTNRRRQPARRSAASRFRLDPPRRRHRPASARSSAIPFVPADPARLEQDCYEAYNIQVSGLAQRLRATGIKRVVIGVSGGLDSTQALIVCAQALRPARAAAQPISLPIRMPGFATSDAHQGQRHPR